MDAALLGMRLIRKLHRRKAPKDRLKNISLALHVALVCTLHFALMEFVESPVAHGRWFVPARDALRNFCEKFGGLLILPVSPLRLDFGSPQAFCHKLEYKL
jgi:hypothetical protein